MGFYEKYSYTQHSFITGWYLKSYNMYILLPWMNRAGKTQKHNVIILEQPTKTLYIFFLLTQE